MKLYKFISEDRVERYEKKYVYLNGVQISNPSIDVLAQADIKPLEEAVIPQHNEETQFVQPYYINNTNVITKEWKVCDIQLEGVSNNEPENA